MLTPFRARRAPARIFAAAAITHGDLGEPANELRDCTPI